MNRPLSWHDALTLYRYRHEGIYLDSALAVTRGSLFPSALLASLTSTGLISWICQQDGDAHALLGQSHHPPTSPSARITFIAPRDLGNSPGIHKLLDELARQSGEHGAYYLIAEAESGARIYEVLRKSGFAAYTRQRVWRWETSAATKHSNPWRLAHHSDLLAARALYRQAVPEYILHIEPPGATPLFGLVYYAKAELHGYAEVKYGRNGIWVKPYISPAISDGEQALINLLQSIPDRRTRPIHICVRAYQPHLEPALEALGGIPGPEQVVMVKRLAVQQKLRETFKLPAIEGQPEAPPLAQSRRNG